jgi:hypothetical protein
MLSRGRKIAKPTLGVLIVGRGSFGGMTNGILILIERLTSHVLSPELQPTVHRTTPANGAAMSA